jgi:hypothetical protein
MILLTIRFTLEKQWKVQNCKIESIFTRNSTYLHIVNAQTRCEIHGKMPPAEHANESAITLRPALLQQNTKAQQQQNDNVARRQRASNRARAKAEKPK